MASFNRVSHQTPCPICQRDRNCEISDDLEWVRCRRVDRGATSTLGNGAGWLHYLGNRSPQEAPTRCQEPVKTEVDIASPDVLDRVYRRLLDLLDLSPGHLQHLMGPKRQFSSEAVKRRLYKSLPPQGRSDLARTLLREFDRDVLLSVPGFFWSEKGRGVGYLTIAGRTGILCPFIDHRGRIQAFQLKDPTRDGYTWLSSVRS